MKGMQLNIDDIIKACVDGNVEYRIYDEETGFISGSADYDKYDEKYGHTSVDIELAPGGITLFLASRSRAEADMAGLLKLLAESRQGPKGRPSFDELFDNMLGGDAKIGDEILKELKIKPGSRWMTIYIKHESGPGEDIRDILSRSLPKKTAIASKRIGTDVTLLLVEISGKTAYEEMIQYVRGLYQVLEAEFGERVDIGIGSCADRFEDVMKSADRAGKAAVFGRVIDGKEGVHIYDMLGPAMIVSNISAETLEKMNEEVIQRSQADLLDNELLKTIHVYFQNNMNISETARNLYIHRNTLNYRLDKIRKLTGLDLNRFDDAVFLRMILLFKAIPEEKDKS